MDANSKRWVTVADSPHDHEREALAFLRTNLPNRDPIRVWANFELTAPGGQLYEVDALVVADTGVYLVEIKSHPGAPAAGLHRRDHRPVHQPRPRGRAPRPAHRPPRRRTTPRARGGSS